MTTKEQLIHEIEQFPESLLSELLKFLLMLKEYYADEELTLEEQVNIAEAKNAYEAGDYLTINAIDEKVSSIWDLGHHPVECDVIDGAINHDHYLYDYEK
jgi:hypothetical protein